MPATFTRCLLAAEDGPEASIPDRHSARSTAAGHRPSKPPAFAEARTARKEGALGGRGFPPSIEVARQSCPFNAISAITIGRIAPDTTHRLYIDVS